MPATLLAVDDSATMRKVIEMTLAGEDVRVITVDNAETALSMIPAEQPSIVVADVSLPPTSGYVLCEQIKRDYPSIAVLLLSSRFHPYDPSKGVSAKADGFIDKPFDTQVFIDKVQELIKEKSARAAVVLTATQRAFAPKGHDQSQNPQDKSPADVPLLAPAPNVSKTFKRQPTVVYSGHAAPLRFSPVVRAPGVSAKTQVFQPRKQVPAAPVTHPVAPAPTAGLTRLQVSEAKPTLQVEQFRQDSDIHVKLGELGLTAEQVQSVLELSREIVEKVVWEIVPVLAETIIREEIKRLTEEG